MFLITVPAVNWSRTIWFKGNFCFFSTICACYLMHFSGCVTIATASIIVSIHFLLHPFFGCVNNTITI